MTRVGGKTKNAAHFGSSNQFLLLSKKLHENKSQAYHMDDNGRSKRNEEIFWLKEIDRFEKKTSPRVAWRNQRAKTFWKSNLAERFDVPARQNVWASKEEISHEGFEEYHVSQASEKWS